MSSVAGKSWQVRGYDPDTDESELVELGISTKRHDDAYVLEHPEYGLFGIGETVEEDEVTELSWAQIKDPADESEVKSGETSPFEALIERRMENSENNIYRTDATTKHGKTQYKYDQYGFSPTQIAIWSPIANPTIEMWKGEEFDLSEIYVPDQAQEFVETALDDLADWEYGEADSDSYGSTILMDDDPFKITRAVVEDGDGSAEETAENIAKKSREAEGYITNVICDLEASEGKEVGRELMERGFEPTGIRPKVPNSKIHDAQLYFTDAQEPIKDEIYITDETMELLDATGLNYEVLEEGEKSHQIQILPNSH